MNNIQPYMDPAWYASDGPLQTRIDTHQRYSRVKQPWPDWLLDLIPWRGGETVLDAGCGAGAILLPTARRAPDGRVVGMDLSQGMLDRCRHDATAHGIRIHLARADAQRLPFADARFDAVLMNHMLYHVPDIAAALWEARRVLRPGGWFLAATNSVHSMPQLADLHQRAWARAGLDETPDIGETLARRFGLENGGALVEAVFGAVEVRRRPDALEFTTAEPLVAYYASLAPLRGRPEAGERLLAALRAEIQAVIDRDGMCVVDKTAGVFVARR